MMSAKTIISVTATISTIGQFLTGVPICLKVRRKGEAGDVSGLPFAAGTFSCSVWFKYGTVIRDAPMMAVNLSGLLIQAAYLAFYYRYCRGSVSLTAVRRQVAAMVALIAAVYWYVDFHEQDREVAQYRLGFMAASASIAFSASPLASVAEVIRSKSTESLPLPLLLVTFLVMLQWAVYGTMIGDSFVQVPNIICTCICGLQLLLFLVYPRTRKQNVGTATRI
ncbi:sugar transporter SWEET1-like [Amphibalanus amphitrite]|uniref:sugar transporter SWEET1-like n=1 Tax=Amphibalanus amphitrite TaxID=1232801 RepID=UPI001C91D4BD|nr:sugar transporter SWEET1-like [Amphibalanus amphitrite]XP_043209738.1 sugar transporter SWEET1-like [Amphibalanus amphitrite]XP_043209745.1 sugar transporter SWEET1-like [Amphibalanus amphitrite]XP_043209751.1 sugar transporter SWEET1-like [Amphibalanus amphitrite]XP_043209760.1 sugar transporter SWEET1-like [Amphibalanus amphitrite]XP_043209770.1 sugar transporter SWEET1-like [Amphibalanus amphitrite]XP_043209777.1 sugar transporter SWEET1-like [Amphibalanus amphitrite]